MTWLIVVAVALIAGTIGWGLARRPHRDVLDVAEASPPETPRPARGDEALEALRLGVVIADADGSDEFRNSAARAMAGTHAGVLLDAAIERHLAVALAGEQSEDIVEIYGPPRQVFVVRAAPLPSGGAAAFVDDVSERRRVDQVRTDFVANVSHELKTPIGALSVLAETLQDETDLATIHRLAGRMISEVERANSTIDDLMELSRIELGGDREVQSIAVSEIVSRAVDRVRELAARRDISITSLDPVEAGGRRSDVVCVEGDRRQLVSALGNLLENAVKYSDRGGSIHVRVRRSDAVVEIGVTDQGVGIPANDVARIFERFYRVDPARSRATGGTGLGLSIVRHVATQHGGDVLVRSVEGDGSTFTLRLPVAPQEPPAAGPPSVQDTESGVRGT